MKNSADQILITGATGFLGYRLAQTLREAGHAVVGTGRNETEGSRLEKIGARFIRSDLANDPELGKLVEGSRYVVHCAALSSAWGRESDFVQSNVVATRRIAEAARDAGVERFIHISTPSLYVEPKNRVAITEDDPLPAQAINLYAKTKREAEGIVLSQHAQGLSSIILRPQGIIGIGDRSILPRILATARKGFFPVIDGGQHEIDLTPVETVVESILCALRAKPAALGRAYNITNGEPIRNYEMIQKILKELGVRYREKPLSFRKAWNVASVLEGVHRAFGIAKEPLLTRYSACVLGKTRTLSIERAKNELGFQPALPLDTAIERILPWLKTSGS